MKTLIQLQSVTKSYPKIQSGRDRLFALLSGLANQPYRQVHEVIKSVSLEVKQGESLGLIGENGAGKSTLLKLIAGVLNPTTGQVQLNGKVAALLELGAGFHPDYSGIDNIRMNAALAGLDKAKFAQKLDDIINFADIGDYIYEPIKHYSSGMVVRLGFALMTAHDPELLITDEVLAVGDESFQKKCIKWMEGYLANGGTLLLCSHGMYHIQKLCKHAIWVESGNIREYGDAHAVTQSYLSYHERKSQLQSNANAAINNEGHYAIKQVQIVNDSNKPCDSIEYRQSIKITGVVYSPDDRPPTVAIGIDRIGGVAVYGCSSWMDGITLKRLRANEYAFSLFYPEIALLPGEYHIKAHAMDPEALRLFDQHDLELKVVGKTYELGSCHLVHQWLDTEAR